MMEKRPTKGCVSYILLSLSFLVGAAGWAEFLFKPVKKILQGEDRDLFWLINDLLSFRSETYDVPVVGYIFLISAAFLIVFAILLISRPVQKFLEYLEVSEAPVSILKTTIELRIMDAMHVRSEVRRNQKIHANRPDVHAYHHTMTVTNGSIENDSWKFESKIDGELITKDPLITVTTKSLEVIERFSRALPTNRIVTYLPNNLVLMAHDSKYLKWFKSLIVTRVTRIGNINEYNGHAPIFQLVAVRYPASNVQLIVNFPSATAPNYDEIQCFLISNNVAESIRVIEDSDEDDKTRCIYKIEISSLKQQHSLRFQWSNKKLHEVVGLTLP